ncbi:efflux transporter periplasmic adaptor subunit [Marivirga lumbricoides]|uniref:Efflux transporter periplasmic adaptor subunit n=1 Tax=Marivirga lumbricoides TaxID=1046115 RepID=A0A2T4DL57_9BACT|nr:efflux transporter periplasmic adaptor subunit [Marivirga lumbricoides]
MSKKKTIIISVIILVAATAVTLIIFMTEPSASKSGATKETAMLVDIETVQRGNFSPIFEATGNVQPAEDVMLSPRVSGEIVRRADQFTPGATVKKGQMLLQIDPADYRNTLQLRQSELMQAQSDLTIEQGRQDIARQDYQLIGDAMASMDESLVLREPQLNAVKASYKAAQASVNQARLNLQRTTIKAPFNGQIITRNVNQGSQVAIGDNLGRIVSTDEYWVVVSLPVSKLPWLKFAANETSNGSSVKILDTKAWKKGSYRIGNLRELIGALENQTRMARLIVSVPDPLALQPENEGKPSMLINAFVEVNIEAEEIKDVVRLNRDFVRKNETVWVMKNNKLRINEVEIMLQDARYAYISSGLSDQDSVVTTSLATVANDVPLRLKQEEDTESGKMENREGHE